MSVAKQLYQLQEVDLELEANEESLRRIASQLGESQRVIQAQTRIRQEQQRLEELRRQQRATEWETEDLSAKIKAGETKLYGGKVTNPKELTNLQNEVTALRTRRSQLEDKVLDIMEQMERGEAGVATLSRELRGLEAEWQRQQQRLSQELEQVKAALSGLKAKREVILAGMEPPVADLYHQLRNEKGTAVARVAQGICSSCRISLSSAQLQQVRGSSLVHCSNCGRILFVA